MAKWCGRQISFDTYLLELHSETDIETFGGFIQSSGLNKAENCIIFIMSLLPVISFKLRT